ncbi:MAG TPA: polysaccharide deacetylase family protein [Geodermatophilus sp.]|nr:polysaccharide deacetylase family protein [Geodermatophilus sp.]
MERRRFLLFLAAGLAGTAVGRGTTGLVDPATDVVPSAVPVSEVSTAEPRGRAPVQAPEGVIDRLPGEGNGIALTIDDGTNTEVVAAFAAFAKDSGVRLTFFPNGRYESWEDNADVLRPLVESGQVAMGNHTWSHPDITTLGDAEVAEEIRRNRQFLQRVFGAGDTPFFRPPFGAHDDRTDRIAAEEGHPTIAMWNGTLEDHRVLTGEELMDAAREWFAAQSIIVGHANHRTVTTVYGELLDLIVERELQTVTLADAWSGPAARLRGRTVTGTVTTA